MKTIFEIRIENLLSDLTNNAINEAVKAFQETDGWDAPLPPTSLRMHKGSMAFYDALSLNLGISRNSLICNLLDHLAITAVKQSKNDHRIPHLSSP